jgi:hypothetical protein
MATAAGLGEAVRYDVALNWEPMLGVVHNEQTKLTATALNNIAVATVIAGFLGPVLALRLDSATVQADAITVLASATWLLAGWILHLVARLVLLGLKE